MRPVSQVLLHGETLVSITTAIVATVAEVESGSTFCETCLETKIRKRFTKPTITLHGAMLPETCFATPLQNEFQIKVSNCNSGLKLKINISGILPVCSQIALVYN